MKNNKLDKQELNELAVIYFEFMDDLIEIGIDNIKNGLVFDSPEEQLMDSLEEFNTGLEEVFTNQKGGKND